ncbi:MAG: GMC family oxidoreductase N-terminal domain-containing protein [Spirochaetes bacterium]|nr:GMC family oxidoreductase N-terminal domain-containing protein [Spirochaetota bacterium]
MKSNKYKTRDFDYIIVGGGSAGCLLANRLSADSNVTVCLIEAGGDGTAHLVNNCNPINMLFLMNSRKFNWRFYAEGNSTTGKRRFYWPRGKTLGGSSSVNAMIYTRGHKSDFDHWARLGNKGWDYKSVLPYFMKSERQQRGADKYHGALGEMDTVDSNYHFPASEAFVKACGEAGYPHNRDINGAAYEGVDFFQLQQTPQGRRAHSAQSFLYDVMHRSNLTVMTHTLVKRIRFAKKNAVGVDCVAANDKKTVIELSARKEIILSAGVIGSPHILKLSGIGPADELKRFGIPLVHNLPGVGENLQDHPDVILRYRAKNKTSLTTVPAPYMVRFMAKFYQTRKPHIFTPTDAGGFVKSDKKVKVPDLQLQFAAVRMRPHGRGIFTPSKPGFVLHVCHMRPKSRGRVLLQSADPFVDPRIEANYFGDTFELDALVKGVKIARTIIAQEAMGSIRQTEEVPGPAVQTDAEIREFILQKAESVYHTAGSCKMGRDKLAVVDHELKVRGLKNLRVIDSSIMPTITGSNIHAPTVMIAEKGAAMVLAAR